MKKIFVLLIFLTAMLTGCMSLHTPDIHGVIVDADTGKPIEGARVYMRWDRRYGTMGGDVWSPEPIKTVRQIVGADGRFMVPSHLVLNLMPYPFGKGGDAWLYFYAWGYKYDTYHFNNEFETSKLPKYKDGRQELLKTEGMTVKLKPVQSPEEWLNAASDMYRYISNHIVSDNDYFALNNKLFLERYGTIRNKLHIQEEIMFAYARTRNYKAAIRTIYEIFEDFPDEKKHNYYTNKIQLYEQKLAEQKNKIREGKP